MSVSRTISFLAVAGTAMMLASCEGQQQPAKADDVKGRMDAFHEQVLLAALPCEVGLEIVSQKFSAGIDYNEIHADIRNAETACARASATLENIEPPRLSSDEQSRELDAARQLFARSFRLRAEQMRLMAASIDSGDLSSAKFEEINDTKERATGDLRKAKEQLITTGAAVGWTPKNERDVYEKAKAEGRAPL